MLPTYISLASDAVPTTNSLKIFNMFRYGSDYLTCSGIFTRSSEKLDVP
jgi:hypothetical protein